MLNSPLRALIAGAVAVACGQSFIWAQGPSTRPPTFSKDVAPIFYKNCASCHQPNSVAPMSLLDFQSARPYAKAIQKAVETRTMPPWFADPRYGHFQNDARLSDDDIATIKAWVIGGAPEGNPQDLPPQPALGAGFKLGPPDLVIDIGQDFIVPPGDDVRKNFTVPTNLTEDKWIRAAEILPGNPKLVHHVHLNSILPGAIEEEVDEAGDAFQANRPGRKVTAAAASRGALWQLIDGQQLLRTDAPVVNDGCAANLPELPQLSTLAGEGGTSVFGVSQLPGRGPEVFDVYGDGSTAKFLPKGAKLRFAMHYAKVPVAMSDRTKVGLYFSKRAPDRPVKRITAPNHYFSIPAGAENYRVTRCLDYTSDKLLLAITPHMHYRGKDARYELVHPDGRREILLYVPKYDFNWQQIYRFEQPVYIEKGSRMIITFHYDNSAANRANPDPNRLLRWGDRSEDEMMQSWTEVIDPLPSR